MLIRYGFEIDIQLSQPTTLITAMDVHESQRRAIHWETEFNTSPKIETRTIVDEEGNRLRRFHAQPGVLELRLLGLVRDSGALDDIDPNAAAIPMANLPADALPYLRGSRYCETDLLSDFAWSAFGSISG